MNSLTKETKLTLLYIFIAYTFSVLMRMIWIYQFEDYEAFKFAGEFMINTNDGYYWAEGARDVISGISQDNDLSPITLAVPQFTAFLYQILPFSFEMIILYMPVYLSSLVVIPIILIAKDLKNLEMGLITAMLASVAWSYYNRTMVGYFDTDMLNIVFPMFLLWSIIWAIDTNEEKYILITAIDILLYRWWYPISSALEFSFFGLILIYTLLFDRKNIYNYKFLALILIAMSNLDEQLRLFLVIGIYILFKQEKLQRYVYHILVLSVILFLVTGGLDPIWLRLKLYIFSDSVAVSEVGLGLHFFTVMQTIREASQIPFETFANRISGHVIVFILSLIGYIYLVYKHRIMLFSLPMVGLGFLASVGGLRFTIYAVPILAFGIAYLITHISSLLPTQKMKYLNMALFTILILLPNYKHIESYKVPTVLNSNEAIALDTLKAKADREDYTVAWWDYGYPIRYYADVKTLIDGGKHEGDVNFPISFMLTSSQEEAAKMARLDVEYTEKNYKERAKFSNIEQMTKDYGFDDTNDFLLSLQTDIELPEKTRDIYFYLPYNMINIYPTVTMFSNLDLMSGEKFKKPFYFISRNFKELGKKIQLADNIFINRADSSLELNGKKILIRRFIKTGYTKDKVFQKNVSLHNFGAELSVIYMSSYNTFLVLDEKSYNSLYIQLMVLESYNKELFEQIVVNPFVKIYKLKI